MLHFTHFFFFWHLFKFQFSNSMRLFDLKFLKYIWYIYINKLKYIRYIYINIETQTKCEKCFKNFTIQDPEERLHTGSWRTVLHTGSWRTVLHTGSWRTALHTGSWRTVLHTGSWRTILFWFASMKRNLKKTKNFFSENWTWKTWQNVLKKSIYDKF